MSVISSKLWKKSRKSPFLSLSLFLSAALFSIQASAFSVQVATAPDNSLPLILSAIENARQSLLINVYELASPEVAQALINQINRGLHVEILQEGEPVGGISASSRGLHAQIAQAMEAHPGCCRYGEMHKSAGNARRFHFDHAKYIVIDQSALMVGSENYSPGGQPEPGTQGNRGWEVLVFDAQPAHWFAQMFALDSDPRQPDIVSLLSAKHTFAIPTSFMPSTSGKTGRVNPMLSASDGQILTSPDTSLKGLLGLIQSARQTLDIEQMSFNMNWGNSSSPLFDAIVAAARRGVRIRILLNDEYAFSNGGGNRGDTDGSDGTGDDPMNAYGTSTNGKTTTNRKTVAALTQIARQEHLALDARIANLRAMGVSYIHNKGMIVDGNVTLISSINWTQNAVTNNREAALALKSPQVAAYFGQAFNQDWTRSSNSVLGGVEPSFLTPPAEYHPIVVPPACPSQLTMSAEIGGISPVDNLDPSYLALQHTKFIGGFLRDLRDRRCILLGSGNLAAELRLAKNGDLIVDLEGYTSNLKPFSVRAEFAPNTQIPEPGKAISAQGSIYEGNSTGGGRRRRLGPAALSIQM